jgi:hypothetical protein
MDVEAAASEDDHQEIIFDIVRPKREDTPEPPAPATTTKPS